MKTFAEAVGLLFAIVLVVWGCLIWFAQPNQKPVIACKPLYIFTSGVEKTGSAAASATQDTKSPATITVHDATTNRVMPLQDRVAIGCLRFTDRLFNK